MNSLTGKVAIVTGGAQGIGLAIVTQLAQAGASVVVADMNQEASVAAVEKLKADGKTAMAVSVNVALAEDVKKMVDATLSAWGRLDILVNNAGITRDGLLLRMKDSDWDTVMSVNLKGVYLCIKAVLPSMMKQSGGGRIVNISSIAGAMGNAGQANYAASKAALLGLTKTVAREYASRGITVNAVAPGFIDTAMTAVLSPKVRETLMKEIPLARLGTPDDIAHAVAFLVSGQASYITGQVIHVNGGMYM